jgi:hypothetical protein
MAVDVDQAGFKTGVDTGDLSFGVAVSVYLNNAPAAH